MKKNIIRMGVVSALAATTLGVAGAGAASASPAATASRAQAVTVSVAAPAAAAPVAGAASTSSTTSTLGGANVAGDVDPTISRRKIFNAVKRAIGAAWNACANAARAGYAAFQRWFNGLPRPVQIAIRAAALGSDLLWIYELIREFL
jgi:hypothetical protein